VAYSVQLLVHHTKYLIHNTIRFGILYFVNRNHQEIVMLFRNRSGSFKSKHNNSYIGSSKFSYHLGSSVSRKLIKDWLKTKTLTTNEYKTLLVSLSKGESYNEISAIGKLLEYRPKLRKDLDPKIFDSLLERAEGWAEVDSICYGNFTPEEMLSNWNSWKSIIKKFSEDKNVHKRRASLVLLTKAVRNSDDKRLSKLAFENIGELKGEKDILITKAISWLLRDLIKNHRSEVEKYLMENFESLPKIAIRETTNKLKSGRKTGR
jgi:3-methyladenine DNA glycosylase AlkD